ncbi:MAG: hypothetical protein ABJK37_22175 [Paraglaciecola sp.]|uniref:hypothetical protein n=1 Tax=Paraglaciecola sp. TaxID=1920173 RepID=UPI003299CE10
MRILLFMIYRYALLLQLLLISTVVEGVTNCGSVTDLWNEALSIEQLSVQDKLQENNQTVVTDIRAEKFVALFENCIESDFTDATLKNLSTNDKDVLYQLMHKITFYSQNDSMLSFITRLLKELPSEDLNKKRYAETLYSRYIANWMFAEAQELKTKFELDRDDYVFKLSGNLEGSRQVITPFLESGKLQEKNELLSERHVVVVGSLFCQPSERFSEWLKGKPELRKIMAKHSTWITRQNGDLRLNEVLEYNYISDHQPYSFVYKKDQWSEITYWGTPTFYFFEQNSLVRQIVGWPKEGREVQLREALAAIGLL